MSSTSRLTEKPYPNWSEYALTLAQNSLCVSNPNPRVGCVIIGADGEILGQGFTQQAGGPHAEIKALQDAREHGRDPQGATAYVTLEPCSHYGRTGPCCDALIEAGIIRVVSAVSDPNPLVAGRGFERLRAAGIRVEVGPGATESRDLNIGFFSRLIRGTPWVRLKAATSIDGVTALENGASQWITSSEARTDGHAWRARACAVLTGIGTVLQDDPRLDARDVTTPRQPHLVIVDSQLQTPLDAQLFRVPQRQVLIYTASEDESKMMALRSAGAHVICLPTAKGKVNLAAMLRDLAQQRSVNELHVEAGAKLNGSLIREGLVDEFLVYMAPTLLGSGRGIAQWGPLESLAGALKLEFRSVDQVGPDIRLLARVAGRDEF